MCFPLKTITQFDYMINITWSQQLIIFVKRFPGNRHHQQFPGHLINWNHNRWSTWDNSMWRMMFIHQVGKSQREYMCRSGYVWCGQCCYYTMYNIYNTKMGENMKYYSNSFFTVSAIFLKYCSNSQILIDGWSI